MSSAPKISGAPPDDMMPHSLPRSRRATAIVNVAFTYGNSILALISGVLLVPFYLNYFSFSSYGAWLASGNVVALLAALDGGLNIILGQRLASTVGSRNWTDFSRTAAAGLCLSTIAGCIVGAAGIVFAPQVGAFVNSPVESLESLTLGIRLTAIGAGISIVQSALFGILQARQRAVASGLGQIAGSFVGIAATVLALHLALGIAALGVGVVCRSAANLLCFIWAVYFSRHREPVHSLRVHAPTLRHILRESVLLFGIRITSAIMGNSEVLIASAYIGPHVAATLAIVQRAYGIVLQFLSPLYSSAFAGIAQVAAEHDGRANPRVGSILTELFKYLGAAAALMFGVAAALNENFIRLWLGREGDFGGWQLNAACAAAMLVMFRLTALANILNALGVIGQTAWISLLELATRLLLMALLIPLLGVTGMPLATLLGSGIISGTALTVLLSRRVDGGRQIAIRGLLTSVGGLALGLALAAILPDCASWASFAGVSFMILLIFGGGVFASDKDIRRALSGRRWPALTVIS
jgi:O-antigen/teichoic acid export membrane protein